MSKSILLQARGLQKHFGDRGVLDIEEIELYQGDRIGLVGENGAGKSTLLGILAGEIAPDSGTVSRFCPLGYIRQLGGEDRDAPMDKALQSLFSAQEAREGLSGGERARRRIAAALSQNPLLLLADEPTNDLDIQGVAALEKQLSRFDGALVLVSHDRALLDKLCNVIYELEDGRITVYPGNYSDYRAQKEQKLQRARFEYQQYRAEQARLSAAIQGKREHASQVVKLPSRMGISEARLHRRSATETEEKLHKTRKALETRLEHLEEKPRPREEIALTMRPGSFTPIVSKTVLTMRDMNLRAGSKILLQGASMTLPTGSKTALMGPNGCGKTTLIGRILKGNDPRIRLSPGVKLGWFGQDHAATLDMDKSALDNVAGANVFGQDAPRRVLARLNLKEQQILKPARLLSGGERAKTCLARLLVGDYNLLILDEPTNHLDVFAMEALGKLLMDYAGTLLLVSHDRAFVEKLCGRLVIFEHQRLTGFEGGLSAYYAAQNKPRLVEREKKARIDALEMRLAALAARLAKPGKKDDPVKLDAEYRELARELRGLKG